MGTPSLIARLALPAAALLLGGCVAGQSLQTGYESPAAAAPAAAAAAAAVSVSVSDDRPFVRSGEKPPHYIGKYRAGFGNPWDVSTENDEPLADILARDLKADLAAMGYRAAAEPGTARSLSVSIVDWNFDGYQNGRFWYELRVRVTDPDGRALAADTVQESTNIKGTFWMGARGGFEREMPKLYPRVVRKLVRENDKISAALKAGGT